MTPALLSPASTRTAKPKRSLEQELAPLDQLAANSPSFIANHNARFELQGQAYELPRYLLIGPKGGGDMIRVGIFAGIHGDEPEGVHALVRVPHRPPARTRPGHRLLHLRLSRVQPLRLRGPHPHLPQRQRPQPRILDQFSRARGQTAPVRAHRPRLRRQSSPSIPTMPATVSMATLTGQL